jgi:hypothetical protein
MPSVKPNGCKGPVLCPSYPIYDRCDECCDYRWIVNLGLLYQQPWMSNMGAGTSSVAGVNILQIDNVSNAPYANTTIRFLEECFDYSLGITAGIGYFMEHDNWFFLVDFDWLSSNITNSYSNVELQYSLQGFTNPTVQTAQFGSNIYLFDNLYTSLISKANLDIYDLNFALSCGSFSF